MSCPGGAADLEPDGKVASELKGGPRIGAAGELFPAPGDRTPDVIDEIEFPLGPDRGLADAEALECQGSCSHSASRASPTRLCRRPPPPPSEIAAADGRVCRRDA
jgi:hypothetical protein